MREFQPTQEARPDGVPATVAHYLPSLSGLSLTLMAGHLLIGAINPLLLVPAGLAVTAMLHSGKVQSANDARARGELMQHIRTVLTQVRVMPGRSASCSAPGGRAGRRRHGIIGDTIASWR
jgi:hypothetical protein